MGDWRTVNIEGAMAPNEAEEMIEMLSQEYCWDTPAACLSIGIGVYGLGQWVKPDGMIRGVGNLAERDYNNSDICEALQYLASKYPLQTWVCRAFFITYGLNTTGAIKNICSTSRFMLGSLALLCQTCTTNIAFGLRTIYNPIIVLRKRRYLMKNLGAE